MSKNTKVVLEILQDEIRGDVAAALRKMTKDYSMTWVYQSGKTLFPRTKKNIKEDMQEAYPIKGRAYDIRHVAEGKNVVMVELVESYPDPKTKKVYRTPLVLVLEMRKCKIAKGRHYCDPRISYMHLTKKQIARAFR